MNETILESLLESGSITESDVFVAVTSFMTAGELFSLVRSSDAMRISELDIDETKVLIAIGKTGKVNISQLAKETVSNIKIKIADLSNSEAITELKKVIVYLKTMIELLDDYSVDEDIVSTPITTTVIPRTSSITVVGSAI